MDYFYITVQEAAMKNTKVRPFNVAILRNLNQSD